MIIYFATDHAGFALKEKLLIYVRDELGYAVEDCGAFVFNEVDDYPDFVIPAIQYVAKNPTDTRAIICGGSGQGEAIVANKYKGIRAVVYYGGYPEIITLSREHNNANVLSFGARFVSVDEAKNAVKQWLHTSFSNDERHIRRINKIET
jgi:ribose 5-phosphate isomerase B